jgi:hypothetical protein
MRDSAGLTVIEAIVATFIIFAVFLGFWMTYDTNREIWDRGRDKVLLQQALTQAAEEIARDVRSGSSVALSGGNDLTIYDRSGAPIRRYFVDSGVSQLSTAVDEPVVPETCTALSFTLGADTTEVLFRLTLKDKYENSATIRSSAHLRNLEDSFLTLQGTAP